MPLLVKTQECDNLMRVVRELADSRAKVVSAKASMQVGHWHGNKLPESGVHQSQVGLPGCHARKRRRPNPNRLCHAPEVKASNGNMVKTWRTHPCNPVPVRRRVGRRSMWSCSWSTTACCAPLSCPLGNRLKDLPATPFCAQEKYVELQSEYHRMLRIAELSRTVSKENLAKTSRTQKALRQVGALFFKVWSLVFSTAVMA